MKKKVGVLVIVIFILGIFFHRISNENRAENNNRNDYTIKILPEKTNEMSQIYNDKFIINENQKYGIMNISGNMEIDSEYDLINRISQDTYLFQKGEKREVWDLNSNKKIEVETIENIGEKFFKVLFEDKYGIIDEKLNEVLKMEYDFIVNNNNYIIAYKGEKRELYDIELNSIKNQRKHIELGVGEYLYNRENNRFGVIDKEGKQIIGGKYDSFTNLNDKNVIIGYQGTDQYFINLEKNIEKKVEYENYSIESQGLIMVLKNGKIGYIDDEGNEVVPLVYDGGFIPKEKEKYLQVKKDKKWLLLSRNGKEESIELIYDDIGENSEGYILVESQGKFGYIDERGEEKIPLEYEFGTGFKNGVAVVAKESGFGVIDKENRVLIPMDYDEIIIRSDKVYVSKNNKFGILDLSGQEILPIVYDKLVYIDENTLFFKENEKTGYFKFRVKDDGYKKL